MLSKNQVLGRKNIISMEIKTVQNITDQIDGWLSNETGELLYFLAKQTKGKGVIVEIGSWKGKSTIWLGKGSQAGGRTKVYAIDPHTGSKEHRHGKISLKTLTEFKKNVEKANLDDIVHPIIDRSDRVAHSFTLPVELIFIDGAHEYEKVKKDFDLWYPKVIEEGWMVFHDSLGPAWPGPKRVVDKHVLKSNKFKHTGFIGVATYAQKSNCVSILDKTHNLYIFIEVINRCHDDDSIANKSSAVRQKINHHATKKLF